MYPLEVRQVLNPRPLSRILSNTGFRYNAHRLPGQIRTAADDFVGHNS